MFTGRKAGAGPREIVGRRITTRLLFLFPAAGLPDTFPDRTNLTTMPARNRKATHAQPAAITAVPGAAASCAGTPAAPARVRLRGHWGECAGRGVSGLRIHGNFSRSIGQDRRDRRERYKQRGRTVVRA